MRLALLAGLITLLAVPAHAQVMEIGSGGEVQTFDGPTLFTADGAKSLRSEKPVAARSADSAALLTDAAQLHGLDPALLKAVAWRESNGRMAAVSNRGALGVMQLMPATAAELGVNPNDLADNIRGGALYLRQQIERFGSVPLALAAYNAGPGAVIRYRGVPPFRETQDYVTRIMQRWHPKIAPAALAPLPPADSNSAVIEVPQL